MKWIGSVLFFFPVVLVITSCNNQNQKKMIKPPVAEKIPYKLTEHGDTRIDNYYWMRLSDAQKNAKTPDEQTRKVLDYLHAENHYTEAMLRPVKQLRETLFQEITGRIKKNDESVPYLDNGYYYYTRYEEHKEYPVYCRKKGSLDAPEEVMLNANELAAGHNFFQIGGWSVSPDNKILAFGMDTIGRRRYVILFKDLTTGNLLNDEVKNTTGSPVWANDNKTVFYTRKNKETLRAEEIRRHELGQPSNRDAQVFFEKDETFSTGIFKTKSRKYLMIYSGQTLSTEYRYLDADNPKGTFRVVQPRKKNLEYHVDHFGNYFYIRTNAGGAKNFKLVRTPLTRTSMKNWQEVIPYDASVYLTGFEIFKNYLVLSERIRGLTQIRVIPWKNRAEGYFISFDEPTYVTRPSVNPEFNTDILRFSYSSLVTPRSIYDFNMGTKKRVLMKQDEVEGGYDPSRYEEKRLYAMAKDSVRVPISLVYKKGLQADGNNPVLIYGYGSYGYPMDPYFSSVRISLLDRGFIYAIAHIRGGGDLGRQWYEDGKLLKKMNTFTDFIASSEYLVDQNYTNPGRLFAMGGSAGGLLMGAVANMSPGLYKGIIANVPFVDVITTMLDETIPLTTFEYDEWGNPHIKKYYDYMMKYSPYDNVKQQNYPNMLVTTGYWDSQVQYWEPTKWVARLRDMKTDNNLLLLHVNFDAGHGGASGRFRRYRETAMEYAFMLHLLGMDE
ncbi:MAG: S9 family peptidase [Bacteroidales bacterium]|nr:S9 family peptidase [Bacteroidales bacterium]